MPPLDAVEEVQVVTSQFSAEYGRASGGRVNLRTRGGANDLRGRAFYYFRDESLDANTWNNNRRGLKRLPLQEHNRLCEWARDGLPPQIGLSTSRRLMPWREYS